MITSLGWPNGYYAWTEINKSIIQVPIQTSVFSLYYDTFLKYQFTFVRRKRRIFGSKRDENGQRRRLYNKELNSLYRSPNIVREIKSRRLIVM